MALAGGKAGAAQRDALIERHVVADVGRLADHHPRAVVDEEALSDARGGVDLDTGERASEHRDHARQDRHLGALQRVCDAVGEQRMDARPGREDLELPGAASRRIAVPCSQQVAANLLDDPSKGAETRHDNSVAANSANVAHATELFATRLTIHGGRRRAWLHVDGRRGPSGGEKGL